MNQTATGTPKKTRPSAYEQRIRAAIALETDPAANCAACTPAKACDAHYLYRKFS